MPVSYVAGLSSDRRRKRDGFGDFVRACPVRPSGVMRDAFHVGAVVGDLLGRFMPRPLSCSLGVTMVARRDHVDADVAAP